MQQIVHPFSSLGAMKGPSSRRNSCVLRSMYYMIRARFSIDGVDPCRITSRLSFGALGRAANQPTARLGTPRDTRRRGHISGSLVPPMSGWPWCVSSRAQG